jgi:sulfur-carrier protein
LRVPAEEIERSGITVRIPSALRTYTRGQEEVVLDAASLDSLLARLEDAFPGIRSRIVDETGRLRQYVNLFVNDDLVRDPLPTVRLAAGDAVFILPSIAGGSHG